MTRRRSAFWPTRTQENWHILEARSIALYLCPSLCPLCHEELEELAVEGLQEPVVEGLQELEEHRDHHRDHDHEHDHEQLLVRQGQEELASKVLLSLEAQRGI